jgi:transcriptional regulator
LPILTKFEMQGFNMYKLPEFTETDMDAVMAFIKAHNFITLIGNKADMPVATQVPVLFDERDGKIVLRGHIMRKTDHHLAFEQNNNALVLFSGPHCFVSASWYKERGIGSTWNYMTVQARGQLQFTNEAATIQLLADLTAQYEQKQPYPQLLSDLAEDYVAGMVKAIAGFEIVIEELHPIFKLSQNRSDESYKSIVAHLEKDHDCGAEAIVGEMIRRRPALFNL